MCKPIIDLLLLHREPPLRPSLPLRHLPPLLPVGFDGLRIDEKNESERRKASNSIKDRGASKPNHQRPPASTTTLPPAAISVSVAEKVSADPLQARRLRESFLERLYNARVPSDSEVAKGEGLISTRISL